MRNNENQSKQRTILFNIRIVLRRRGNTDRVLSMKWKKNNQMCCSMITNSSRFFFDFSLTNKMRIQYFSFHQTIFRYFFYQFFHKSKTERSVSLPRLIWKDIKLIDERFVWFCQLHFFVTNNRNCFSWWWKDFNSGGEDSNHVKRKKARDVCLWTDKRSREEWFNINIHYSRRKEWKRSLKKGQIDFGRIYDNKI